MALKISKTACGVQAEFIPRLPAIRRLGLLPWFSHSKWLLSPSLWVAAALRKIINIVIGCAAEDIVQPLTNSQASTNAGYSLSNNLF